MNGKTEQGIERPGGIL